MRSRLPARDPVSAHQRKAVAARRVGEGAKCSCGEARPEALIAGSNPIICTECQRKLRGQSITDNHHVAGETNSSVTIPVPANDHSAILNVAQYDWPQETLKNESENQYLKMAASIRGYIDTQRYFLGKLLEPIPEVLEKLAELECRKPRK